MIRPLALVLCLAAWPALATNPPKPADPNATATAAADADAHADAAADARAHTDVDIEAPVDIDLDVDAAPTLTLNHERSAPAVFSPSVYPTAPCVAGWSAGASGPAGGLSIGRGKELEGCVTRELIRIGAQMGMTAQASLLWCSQEQVAAVFGTVEACLNYGAPPVTDVQRLERCENRSEALAEGIQRRDDALAECWGRK